MLQGCLNLLESAACNMSVLFGVVEWFVKFSIDEIRDKIIDNIRDKPYFEVNH